MKLVAGLGNPGEKYRGTRHNVGFAVLDHLAIRVASGEPFISAPVGAIQLRWRRAEGDVLFVKPLTFMNLSGEAIGGLMPVLQARPGRFAGGMR